MKIPDENVYELKEASWKDLEDMIDLMKKITRPLTLELENSTGICGTQGYRQGILWDRAKLNAMNRDSTDYIIVSHLIV